MTHAIFSIDLDGCFSLFKSANLEDFILERGPVAFQEWVDTAGIKATLFVVARDVENHPGYRSWVKQMADNGHEIANHSYDHFQDMPRLTSHQMQADIRRSHQILEDLCGQPVKGFRAPGWNMDAGMMDVLEELGYIYDSSVFPTSLIPIMKLYYSLKIRSSHLRTMGSIANCVAPLTPYFPAQTAIHKRGQRSILEIPLATSWLRLPFMGTFLFSVGFPSFAMWLNQWKMKRNETLVFEAHLAEFVTITPREKEYLHNLPHPYIPPTLTRPLVEKISFYDELLNRWRENYRFTRMVDYAREVMAGEKARQEPGLPLLGQPSQGDPT